jgi:hypothetical protein
LTLVYRMADGELLCDLAHAVDQVFPYGAIAATLRHGEVRVWRFPGMDVLHQEELSDDHAMFAHQLPNALVLSGQSDQTPDTARPFLNLVVMGEAE